jgi:hypothetical protein
MPLAPVLSAIKLALPGRRAARLGFDRSGRLVGAARIGYNTPFPCANGNLGGQLRHGVVMHTMVGNLPGTIQLFNGPGNTGPVSAHFGVSQSGQIWQFGPCGTGWVAWHVAAGNGDWYGIEHADNGNPDIPLTDAQLTASAQIVEALSTLARFPLQEADDPSATGYGVHYMGGASWGGHTCPDLPPDHVRSRQRPVILARAAAIRAGQPLPPGSGPAGPGGGGGGGPALPSGHPPAVVAILVAAMYAGAVVVFLAAAAAAGYATVWAVGKATA